MTSTYDPHDPPPDTSTILADIAAWSRRFLTGDAPVFGSPEWLALPLTDERRAAGVVRAALAWWRCGEPLEDVEARAQAALDVATSHAIADELPWDDIAHHPTHAELARLRDWHHRDLGTPGADVISADWATTDQYKAAG